MNTTSKQSCVKCGMRDYITHMYQYRARWYCPYCYSHRAHRAWKLLIVFVIILVILAWFKQCHAGAITPVVTYSHIDSDLLARSGFNRTTDTTMWVGYETARDSTGRAIGVFPIIVCTWPHYDVTCNGKTNVTDLTVLVNYMFKGKVY